jgi:hypothetical protein
MSDLGDLRYPVGPFTMASALDPSRRQQCLTEIGETPGRVRDAVAGLTADQLDTPYRPGGWTVRQLIHHLADSHLNAYIRTRLALTEDEPAIKTYEQDRWATLADARTAPPEWSLALLDALHARWSALLHALAPADFARTLRHPELGLMTIDGLLAMYSWHGRHHVAHITGLRQRAGW